MILAFCFGAITTGSILLAFLSSYGCLSCPQHDNNDIPMEVIQEDFETTGNDSDLAEAI